MSQFGEFEVNLMSEEVLEGFTIRTISVLNTKVYMNSKKTVKTSDVKEQRTKHIVNDANLQNNINKPI